MIIAGLCEQNFILLLLLLLVYPKYHINVLSEIIVKVIL